MTSRNHTVVTYFQFLPFSSIPEIQGSLFCLVLLIYLSTLLGNILTTLITEVDNLSFLEIGYTTSTIPKMLVNFLTKRKGISFLGCATQMYVLSLLGITECCLLAAMAFDHYVALCRPLAWILHTIFKTTPSGGKTKTLSTCSSHLVVVTLFYGSAIVTYLRLRAFYSSSSNRLLRNREVKQALKRLIAKNINI
uniref:G-protein coupled receptors family 1 profile domain-containing protein n=1 Tax=Bubo bubo TaxID=30461 RepID=A0A8C0FSV6_BUBBB